MPTPSHLDPTASDRGFVYLPALACGGGEIAAFESSAADSPHVWIRTEDEESGKGIALHLPADTAWKFAEQIITAVQNHYQGDATPASAEYQVTRSVGVRNGAGCPCQACTKEA